MTDFGPWVRPLLIGPFLSTFGVVTILHLLLGDHAADEVLFAGHAFDSWLVSMLISGFIAAGIVVNLIVADVALLAVKMRRLPTGFGAWLGALLSPFALHLAMQFFSGVPESTLDWVMHFVLPFPISAFVLRFALGRKPG
jgi:hypothetical protein